MKTNTKIQKVLTPQTVWRYIPNNTLVRYYKGSFAVFALFVLGITSWNSLRHFWRRLKVGLKPGKRFCNSILLNFDAQHPLCNRRPGETWVRRLLCWLHTSRQSATGNHEEAIADKLNIISFLDNILVCRLSVSTFAFALTSNKYISGGEYIWCWKTLDREPQASWFSKLVLVRFPNPHAHGKLGKFGRYPV